MQIEALTDVTTADEAGGKAGSLARRIGNGLGRSCSLCGSLLEERSPMAARTKTKVSPKYKTKYRVKNWAVV